MGRKRKNRPVYLYPDQEEAQAILSRDMPPLTAKAEPEPEPPDSALVQSVREQTTELRYAPVALSTIVKSVCWVLGSNGLFRIHRTAFGAIMSKVSDTKEPTTGLLLQPTNGLWLKVPKVPWELLGIMVAFFRWADRERHSEALVRGYYHYERKTWYIWPPPQQTSGAHVSVPDGTPHPKDVGEWMLEVHSHPGSSATFSSGDDAHERHALLYGCIANLGDKQVVPTMKWRAGTGGPAWVNLSTADLFDLPIVRMDLPMEYVLDGSGVRAWSDPFADTTFDPGWKNQLEPERVRVQPYRTPHLSWYDDMCLPRRYRS